MAKTGTTSIQSSLFYGIRDDRHRLVTLDSFSGNHLVGAAFADDFGDGCWFISQATQDRPAADVTRRSRDYLSKALAAAARHGCTPIISAEIISDLPRTAVEGLRSFLTERRWTPHLFFYARTPIDLLESRFAQRVRRADLPSRIPTRLPAYIDDARSRGYATPLRLADEVFGRDNVTIHWFDPAHFPGGCVVRHFCDSAGIPLGDEDVVRENDSLSLDAIRLLYASVLAGRRRTSTRLERHRRTVLLELLAELPGPSLRFHTSLCDPYIETVGCDVEWLEKRLEHSVPLSLRMRDAEEGVRGEHDLLDYSPESLEWLAKKTGRRLVRAGRGEQTTRAVAEQLDSLGLVHSPARACRTAAARIRELWHRASLRSRLLR